MGQHRLMRALGLFWFSAALFGQQVEKLAGSYVLLSSDKAGRIGDTLVLERDTPAGVRETGVVRLVKIQNGKAAAKIEKQSSLRIQQGDRVRQTAAQPQAVQKTAPHPLTRHTVVKIIQGYALLDSDEGLAVGDELEILRTVSGKIPAVAQVRVIKLAQKLAAARILSETPPFHVQVGDYALSGQPETPDTAFSNLDIDYYFYGVFRSE